MFHRFFISPRFEGEDKLREFVEIRSLVGLTLARHRDERLRRDRPCPCSLTHEHQTLQCKIFQPWPQGCLRLIAGGTSRDDGSDFWWKYGLSTSAMRRLR
jgi:hypothetical protein